MLTYWLPNDNEPSAEFARLMSRSRNAAIFSRDKLINDIKS